MTQVGVLFASCTTLELSLLQSRPPFPIAVDNCESLNETVSMEGLRKP